MTVGKFSLTAFAMNTSFVWLCASRVALIDCRREFGKRTTRKTMSIAFFIPGRPVQNEEWGVISSQQNAGTTPAQLFLRQISQESRVGSGGMQQFAQHWFRPASPAGTSLV